MKVSLIVAAGILLCGSTATAADKYPSRPVKIIVPFAVGGAGDIMARMVAQRLTEQTGQTFLVENMGGAGGRIGYGAVAKANGDGYTLVAIDSTYTMLPALFPDLKWDAQKDIVPVTITARAPFVIATSLNAKAQTMPAMLDAARSNPGKLNYGSAGIGSVNHVVTTFFSSTAKIDLTHVPYKSMGEALTGMMGGSVEVVLTAIPTAIPQINGKKIVPLAVTSEARAAAIPNVPTVTEFGVPFIAQNWFGLAAPKGTPKEIRVFLQQEVAKAVQTPALQQRLAAMGAEAVANHPDDFAKVMQDDMARWAKVIQTSGIRLE